MDGGWGTFVESGPCSVTCGSGGTQITTARCDNPEPIGTGTCPGEAPTSTQPCSAANLCASM